MRIRTALSIFLFTCLAFMAAFLSTSCAPAAPVDNREADAAAIEAADEQWSAAAARNDLDGTLAFYADDAVLVPPNAPIIKEQKSIHDAWAAMLGPNTSMSWKASKVEAAKSGDLGYLYGTYEDSVKDVKGGPPAHDVGKIVEVWKKQSDGKWKCILDAYSSDLPIPPGPEAHK